MQALLVGTGIASVVVWALVGVLKSLRLAVPMVESMRRQTLIGSAGVVLLLAGFGVGTDGDDDNEAASPTIASAGSSAGSSVPETAEATSTTAAEPSTTSIETTTTTTTTVAATSSTTSSTSPSSTTSAITSTTVANVVVVPDLSGRTAADAQFQLRSLGLQIVLSEAETTEQQPGLVLTQDPPPTTAVEPGTSVQVVVALGPFCDGQRATLLVGDDAEVTGTAEADVIVSVGTQPASIGALGGDDRVCLNDAGGRVFGGAGNDRIFASPAADVVFGGDGSDLILGGAGDDILNGEDQTAGASRGDDEIRGDDGDDVVFGGVGNDRLSGGAGRDSIFGAEDDDLIEDGNGAEDAVLDAGPGIDNCPGLGPSVGQFARCESW